MFSYIHIPFCESKCKYCRFASFSNLDETKVEFYIKFLTASIKNYTGKIESLDSIYFGGGTPSFIHQKYIQTIIEILKNKFGLSKNIEITIESTPQNISSENISLWKKMGVTRISLGVQSLQDKTLIEIGRGNKEIIYTALYLLQQADFNTVSVDFIIGLPFVKKNQLTQDISTLLETYACINHVSVYMLEEYYYGEKWKDLILEENDFLPEYVNIKSMLEKKGIYSYELSNFSKKGNECKHNKAYWNHSEVIAFGLGAYGYVDSRRYSFSELFSSYYAGKDFQEENLTLNDKILEKIMFGLRTSGLTQDLLPYINLQKVNELISDGFLDKQGENIILGEKGFTLLDFILKEICL